MATPQLAVASQANAKDEAKDESKDDAGAPADEWTRPQPGPPQAGAPAAVPTSGQPGGVPKAVAPPATGPIVHAINDKPSKDFGVVKLARYVNQSAAATANAVIISVNYAEICNLPCGVPVDNSERPIFFFVRDGQPISQGFRLPSGVGEVTLKVRPTKKGMATAGMAMTFSIFLLPVGIPLWVVGAPKVWAAEGAPNKGQKFVKLKKART